VYKTDKAGPYTVEQMLLISVYTWITEKTQNNNKALKISFTFVNHIATCDLVIKCFRGCHNHDFMVVGFISTYANSAILAKVVILNPTQTIMISIGIICLFVCLMVFNVTFNNISVILWQSVLLVEETGGPRENH
jgi:hypothetical protein